MSENIHLDIDAETEATTLKLTESMRGLLVKARAGRVVTPEMVKALADDDHVSGDCTNPSRG